MRRSSPIPLMLPASRPTEHNGSRVPDVNAIYATHRLTRAETTGNPHEAGSLEGRHHDDRFYNRLCGWLQMSGQAAGDVL